MYKKLDTKAWNLDIESGIQLSIMTHGEDDYPQFFVK